MRFLERQGKPRLAYRLTPPVLSGPDVPFVMFLGGFRSDMEGTKALHLEEQCRRRGQGYVRFDYRGHGSSEGKFEDGSLGLWLEDTLAILDAAVPAGKKVILAGSSMGGWIALLVALAQPDRIAGVVGIAAAPDFTRRFRDELLNTEQKRQIDAAGFISVPGAHGEQPLIITSALLDDAEAFCLLDRENDFRMPVRLIQGMQDEDVPWQTAFRIKNTAREGNDVEVLLIEQGGHRLSQPENLELIDRCIVELSGS